MSLCVGQTCRLTYIRWRAACPCRGRCRPASGPSSGTGHRPARQVRPCPSPPLPPPVGAAGGAGRPAGTAAAPVTDQHGRYGRVPLLPSLHLSVPREVPAGQRAQQRHRSPTSTAGTAVSLSSPPSTCRCRGRCRPASGHSSGTGHRPARRVRPCPSPPPPHHPPRRGSHTCYQWLGLQA